MSCEMTDLTPSLERDKMELRYYCLKDGAREPDYISDEELYKYGK